MSRNGNLYFAFGSNLDAAQMRRRCAAPVMEGRACLYGHRLAFVGFSAMRNGGVASVVADSPEIATPGVLWRLSDDDLGALDKCEGHPGFYRRVQVRVAREGGGTVKAWTYVLDRPERAPSDDYLQIIARGYAALGYPEAYLRAAAARAPVPDTTPVFVYGTLRRGEHNHGYLVRAGAAYVKDGRTQPGYKMVDLGSYPAAVVGGNTSLVGEVYEVDAQGLRDLDALEGVPRLYQRGEVVLQCGLRAVIYTMTDAALQTRTPRPTIAGGDWVRRHVVAATRPRIAVAVNPVDAVVRRRAAQPCDPGCTCAAHAAHQSEKGRARAERKARRRGGVAPVATAAASPCTPTWDGPQRVLALPAPSADRSLTQITGGFVVAGSRR